MDPDFSWVAYRIHTVPSKNDEYIVFSKYIPQSDESAMASTFICTIWSTNGQSRDPVTHFSAVGENSEMFDLFMQKSRFIHCKEIYRKTDGELVTQSIV